MVGRLGEIYQELLESLGPQHWWPAESRFEIMVGAVLTQNTAWRNVERALENLRQAELLTISALAEVDAEELSEYIRPAGYYRQKSKRLKNLVQYIVDSFDGCLDRMFATDLTTLREQLLSLHGIGPETADSILLYAGEKLSFVVDAYTARIGRRHNWLPEDADYHQIQEQFQAELPAEVAVYNEFHALIVQIGKNFCAKSQPDCEACPLKFDLPEQGPASP